MTSQHVRTVFAALVVLWLAATPAQAQAPKPADFELRPSASLQPRVGALAGKLPAAHVAASAHAANTQRCHTNAPRVIKLPRGADVRVTEQTCVIAFPQGAGRAKYKAWVYTTWRPTGSGGIRPKQFEDYNVTARLEINRSGPDRLLAKKTCRIAPLINRVASGSYTCQTKVDGNFGTARVFTGDGSVVYDVDGDGKGNFPTWQLHGSPRVP